jgi:hypothetical protein
MFSPGDARFETSPYETGSLDVAITMGIVLVACLAARATGFAAVTMTSGFS